MTEFISIIPPVSRYQPLRQRPAFNPSWEVRYKEGVGWMAWFYQNEGWSTVHTALPKRRHQKRLAVTMAKRYARQVLGWGWV